MTKSETDDLPRLYLPKAGALWHFLDRWEEVTLCGFYAKESRKEVTPAKGEDPIMCKVCVREYERADV